jgi:hypothetical protein
MNTNAMDAIETAPFPAAGDRTPIDRQLVELQSGARTLLSLPLPQRIELTDACAEGVAAVAREWVEAACAAKRIPSTSPARAEEILAGPVAVLRQLRLLGQTIRDLRDFGRPVLPGNVDTLHGQMRVPVFPTRSLYDRLLFRPMKAEVWLRPGASYLYGENGAALERLIDPSPSAPVVACVLGAGNVSSIPATDALTKILQENRAVLLKLNPVNDYLGPILEQALAPLVEAALFCVAYGGADVGAYLVAHEAIGEVHVTGSIDTHDAIVWGHDPHERERRRAAGTPLLTKPITSELGNVTPWIVVPGKYTDAQLRFQAESVAASIVNNASFNCIATKVIVTHQDWPQRERFLDFIERILGEVPPRHAYYPGAANRFAAFTGRSPEDPEYLPWTLLRDASPDESPHLFERESFVGVCAETALEADSPREFLAKAVEFVNGRLWGTLAAAVTAPAEFSLRSPADLDTALRKLRYGTIGVNQWPGVAYALLSPPWGGYPGSDLTDAQSGIGFVHNTYLLDAPEKTVLSCPLRFFPKPVWFPSHRNAEAVAWSLFALYRRPSPWRLPRVLKAALRSG